MSSGQATGRAGEAPLPRSGPGGDAPARGPSVHAKRGLPRGSPLSIRRDERFDRSRAHGTGAHPAPPLNAAKIRARLEKPLATSLSLKV
jgi:hypothetical protein